MISSYFFTVHLNTDLTDLFRVHYYLDFSHVLFGKIILQDSARAFGSLLHTSRFCAAQGSQWSIYSLMRLLVSTIYQSHMLRVWNFYGYLHVVKFTIIYVKCS